MAKAVKCPVCHGAGTLQIMDATTAVRYEVCHGCNGKGWIEVKD